MEKITRAGIDIIGDVPWGTHFCQFYQTKKDLLDILVPYFRAGLENNEFCMWITSEPLREEDVLEAMRKALPNFDQYLKKGQIEILPHTEWYLKGGEFDSQKVLDGWVDKLNQALAEGYKGLRLTGNTFWLEKRDWRRFRDYENEVNNVIGKYRMIGVCTYCLDKCGANEVIDVISNHQFALIRREGKWELIESFERRRAEEALRYALEESKRRQAEISALLESSRAVLEYREFKDAARFIFDSCKNLIGATAGYIALLSKDGKENEVLFLDSGGLPCAVDPSLPMPIRGTQTGRGSAGAIDLYP
ncbi:MAG: MEDS domain-containing protein [Deltaproteobacteria bacterium]|nr:MEDS domain-containing protein [Deltaproteobacteria bacterium]